MGSPGQRPPLTLPTKLAYGFGSVAFSAKNQLMGLLLLYYNQIVGLPAPWVSAALAVSIVIDAFWDPSIGQWSDGVRSRWGRRHPFMYASVIPSALTFVLLFNPPTAWSNEALFAYMVVMVVLARATISLYEVPATALTPELAPQYDERTQLYSFRYFFATFGGAAAAIVGFGWFLRKTPQHPMGQLNPDGYGPYALTVAIIMMVSILVATTATHKFIPYLHQPAKAPKLMAMLREMVATLSNRNFLVLTAALLSSGVSLGLSSGLNIYFSTYFWELPSGQILIILLGGLVASAIALVLAPVIARGMGKKRAAMVILFAGLVISLTPISLRLVGLMPPNGTSFLVALLLLDRIAASACLTVGAILIASMMGDIVEESQVSTGRRSEGLLLSADNLLQKVVQGLATLLPGLMLAAVAFPQKAKPGSLDPEIMRNLALMYLPAVAVFSTVAIATLSLYRIDRAGHEKNLERLSEATALGEAVREEALPRPVADPGRPA